MFPEGRILDFVIVGVVALIVVGPKDLPVLMRRVGRFLAQMRAMAAEFRASFDEMARQSELDELRREVEALRTGQALHTVVGPVADPGIHEVFDDIHASLRGGPSPGDAAPARPETLATGEALEGGVHADKAPVAMAPLAESMRASAVRGDA